MRNNFCVLAWLDQKIVAGDLTERAARDARNLLVKKELPDPRFLVSVHSTARAADRYAAALAALLADGWVALPNAAEVAEWNDETGGGE